MQLMEIRNTEKVIPKTIMIGPFFVNCSTISQTLSKKHKEQAVALLENVVSRLKRKMGEVSTSFVSSIVPYVPSFHHIYTYS